LSTPALFIVSVILLFFPLNPTATTKPVAQSRQPTDLKITTRYTSGARSTASSEYFSGAWSRREMQPVSANVNGHHRAIITQRRPDKVQVFDLDLDAREYVAYETTLPGTSLRAMPRSQQLQPSGTTVQILSDSVDTGETREMFGHMARHIVTKVREVAGPGACASNAESETDGWYIDYEAFPQRRRPQNNGFAHAITSACASAYDRYEFHHSGLTPGYPLATTTTSRHRQKLPDGTTKEFAWSSTVEVVEFSQAPLDPALFQVPPGFRQVRRLAGQRPQSPAQVVWQWFKDTWDDFFD
jgi:hypothetical protein